MGNNNYLHHCRRHNGLRWDFNDKVSAFRKILRILKTGVCCPSTSSFRSNRIGWEDRVIFIYLLGKTCNLEALFLELYQTTRKNHWDTSYSFWPRDLRYQSKNLLKWKRLGIRTALAQEIIGVPAQFNSKNGTWDVRHNSMSTLSPHFSRQKMIIVVRWKTS